ncbi:MAG: beta-ketoacyl-ACP synthase II [SAR324 cluster bacterium]
MKRRIAVTGMGCVSPLGNDVAKTWDGAAHGRSGVARITKFDPAAFRTQIAAEVKDFDPSGVIEERELKKMDIFIQYSLVAASQAIADSGLELASDERLQEMTGVSVGIGLGGLTSIEKYHEVYLEKGPRRITPFFIPMVICNMASGYISIYFKCKNYNASTVSACSTSNHSIGDAARIIERGDADVMVAGGSEAVITPLGIGGFAAMHAMSTRNDDPAHASRPYDANRDGFVMGEGSGILILEEYERAKARGAKIYCELAGYGFSADAHHITEPSLDGPIRGLKMALRDAGIAPEQVDYINTHGTSTPVGDINELNAVKAVLGDAAYNVSLSSSKSMMGHLLGAAGAVEAILTIKAMEHGLVPPTINIEQMDPGCDLDVTPNQAKERKIGVAISNSFGFGGTNAMLVFKAV